MSYNGISIGHGIQFGQAGYFLGGLLLLLIGITVVYTVVFWHTRALRVVGEIIGIRQSGDYFHNVYRFTLPDGILREATSGQGWGSLRNRSRGRRVDILVMRDQPDEMREAFSPSVWVVGTGALLGGLWMMGFALTAWPPTLWMWIAVAFLAIFLGSKLWRLSRSSGVVPGAGAPGSEDRWAAVPIQQTEDLREHPSAATTGAKQRRTGVVFFITGLGIIAVAAIPTRRLLDLKSESHAQGVVTGLKPNTASNTDPTAFATVQFTERDGTIVRFQDKTGANPSPYKVGDPVEVFYRPGDALSATIDRGWHNWTPVIMLVVLGAAFAGLGFYSLRSAASMRAAPGRPVAAGGKGARPTPER